MNYTVCGYFNASGMPWSENVIANDPGDAIIQASHAQEEQQISIEDRGNPEILERVRTDLCIVGVFTAHVNDNGEIDIDNVFECDSVCSAIDWPGLEVGEAS
jgi:hypothetical protein